MTMQQIRIFAISLLTLGILTQCKEQVSTIDCTGSSPTYTANVKALIDANCATSGCHSASAQANGINLSTYASTKSESSKSRFMGSIQHKSGYDAMPKGAAQLSDANIKTIYCWIENGAPE